MLDRYIIMAGDDCFRRRYEFLNHTADVQIHAWGNDLTEAFESAAVAMTAYITDIDTVEESTKETIYAEADDLEGLLYRYLDEVIFLFNADPFLLSKRVKILEFNCDTRFSIKAECYGETFSLEKHPQGTEIKAITYSAMKITDKHDRHEVFFVVDI